MCQSGSGGWFPVRPLGLSVTYITSTDCSRRLTSQVMIRIFDDDGDGVADSSTVTDFISDAESIIEQSVAKAFGDTGLTALRALGTSCPRTIKRLCIDCFELMAHRRHPEFTQEDWLERWKLLQQDLKDIRLRDVELDTNDAPEPGVTDGVQVADADPDVTDDPTVFFLHGMGIF